MSRREVYFKNHRNTMIFPWSIYHRPLYQSLIQTINSLPTGSSVLVVGPGYLAEGEELKKKNLKVSLLDIDPRVLEYHQKVQNHTIEAFHLVDEKGGGYPEKQFDFIYAKEVIEHVPDPEKFLGDLKRCLRRGGLLWLSTPNYGFFLLPFLERTVLEWIAWLNGFSRKGIHPSQFTSSTLFFELQKMDFVKISVKETRLRLALIAKAINS
jgi:2-polyprenyl-3-methyl-5-hydroxy-6-metoxy-1,4-benzoquinol methylase